MQCDLCHHKQCEQCVRCELLWATNNPSVRLNIWYLKTPSAAVRTRPADLRRCWWSPAGPRWKRSWRWTVCWPAPRPPTSAVRSRPATPPSSTTTTTARTCSQVSRTVTGHATQLIWLVWLGDIIKTTTRRQCALRHISVSSQSNLQVWHSCDLTSCKVNLLSGKNCSRKCKNSVDILLRQNKASKVLY